MMILKINVIRVFRVRYFFWKFLKNICDVYFFDGVWIVLIGWVIVIIISNLINVNLIGVKNFLIILMIFVGLSDNRYVIVKNKIVNMINGIGFVLFDKKGFILILNDMFLDFGIVKKGLIVR